MSRSPLNKRGGEERHADTELLSLLEAREKLRTHLDSIEKKIDALTPVPENYKYWTVNVGRWSISKEATSYPPLIAWSMHIIGDDAALHYRRDSMGLPHHRMG
jgi:hypothetical protein